MAIVLLWSALGCPTADFTPPIVVPPVETVGVVALAGPDLIVLEGSRAALAGRASRAFGGDPQLAWSQVSGPAVLLTNPASPLPAFVAPFAPATLVFELRADAGGVSAVDQVIVSVVSAEGAERAPAGFLEAPADAVAEPGSEHAFTVGTAPGAELPVSISARLSCGDGGSVVVDGGASSADITVVLPDTLPCAVVFDGTDAAGRGLAPAARVFWPAGTALPPPTGLRTDASGPVDPGAAVKLSFDNDVGGRVWASSGDDALLPGGAAAPEGNSAVDVQLPRTSARIAFAGETRVGAASGGVEYAFVDVSDGSGNIAPKADGGPDRVVAPGARFRLDTSASFDLDGDPLTVTAAQVLGPSAVPDALIGGAFEAPAEPGELLFHVVADDGTVLSAPDPVRVVVVNDSENIAPVLTLPATRYAIPGETFAVDGSEAEDPDSGFIELITIAQAEDDVVILLAEPVDAARVELEAGAAGDVYRFLISAYDEEGLGVTVEQTVIVEDAGPYVDAARGDDLVGNGTAAAPFASVGGALGTAVRHDLPELLLAEGVHAPLGVVLPPRVSLRGGVAFDTETGEYVDDALATTTLLVIGEGLGVVDGHLQDLTLQLDSPAASVTLERAATVEGVQITSAADHTAPLLLVRALAAARIIDVVILPPVAGGADAAARAPAVVVEDAGVARFVTTAIAGGDGPDAVALFCGAATISLDNSDITGGAGAAAGTGVRASSGCALDVTNTRVAGGAAAVAIGVDATDTLLTTDALSVITGATAPAESAVAVRFTGRERSALIASTLRAVDLDGGAGADTATGLLCDDAQVGLAGARVEARGPISVAVQPDRCVLGAVNTTLAADTAGIRGAQADDVSLVGGAIDAGDVGLDLDGDFARSLRDVSVSSRGVGVRVTGDVTLEGVTLSVIGADEPIGVEARGATIRDSALTVQGAAARGVVVTGASVLERSTVRTGTSAAAAVSHAGPLSVTSSVVTVVGAPAIASSGPLTLRHATLLVTGASAVHLLGGATLDAANSVIGAIEAAAVEASGAPWLQAVALAFALPGPFVQAPGGPVTTLEALEDLGCDACLVVDPALVLDADGHLLAGPNALVDAGDDDLTTADDVDGEARPQGAGPDVGADERAPE